MACAPIFWRLAKRWGGKPRRLPPCRRWMILLTNSLMLLMGGSAGAGTYVDAAITAAGGRNAAAESGVAGWGRSDPELALTLEADIILTSYFTDGFAGMLSRATRHAAYRRLLGSAGRVDIPSADWPCAGPRLINAAEAIADALDEWAQRS